MVVLPEFGSFLTIRNGITMMIASKPEALAAPCVVAVGMVLTLAAMPARAQSRCEASPRTATTFAAELVDSGRVFGGMLTAEGNELFYFLKQPPLSEENYWIVTSRQAADGRWSAPQRVALGGEHSDMYPTLSADGRRLVFSSYRRAPGDSSAKPNASLWESPRTGTGWGTPTPLTTQLRHGFYHSQVRIDRGGDLYYRRTSPDWQGTETLVARARGSVFEAPERWDAVHRWNAAEVGGDVVGGVLAPGDSLVILEVRTRDPATGRVGWADLWSSRRTAGGYSRPTPLGAGVNDARAHETFVFFSSDGCDLLFVRGFTRFMRVSLAEAVRSGS
ncbi:MAG: hypothetical protein ACT4P7_04720 [Gemmatimonadaceae bacterium]